MDATLNHHAPRVSPRDTRFRSVGIIGALFLVVGGALIWLIWHSGHTTQPLSHHDSGLTQSPVHQPLSTLSTGAPASTNPGANAQVGTTIPTHLVMQSSAQLLTPPHTVVLTVTLTDAAHRPVAGQRVSLTSAWISPDLIPHIQAPYGIITPTTSLTTNAQGQVVADYGPPVPLIPNPVTIVAKALDAAGHPLPTVQAATTVRLIPQFFGGTGTLQERYLGTTPDSPLYFEYLPPGYTAQRKYPLVVGLHGLGGTVGDIIWTPIGSAADSPRHPSPYLLLVPEGRPIAADAGQTGTSGLWFDAAKPPGAASDSPAQHNESDVLQMIQRMETQRNADPRRIYIYGESMGGIGAYGLALRNPGLFAAAGVVSAGTDLEQTYHWIAAGTWSLRDRLVAAVRQVFGDPTASITSHVSLRMDSARFLIENAVNLPLRIWQGEQDTLIPDSDAVYNLIPGYQWPHYLQARNFVSIPITGSQLAPTYTLDQLAQLYPGYYQHLLTIDPTGGHGFPAMPTFSPDQLLAWFDRFSLPVAPDRLDLKTFDTQHTTYWQSYPNTGFLRVTMDQQPDGFTSAFARLKVDRPTNTLTIGVHNTAAVDLDLAALDITTTRPLTITIGGLNQWNGSTTLILHNVSPARKGSWQATINGRAATPAGLRYIAADRILALPDLPIRYVGSPLIVQLTPGTLRH